MRAGGGDGRAARRLFFGDSIQAVGRLLLQGVRAKPGDRQDLTADAQRFTGRHIDLPALAGVRDRQQKIVAGHGLHRRQQGMHILLRNSVDADLHQLPAKVTRHQAGGANPGDDHSPGVAQ